MNFVITNIAHGWTGAAEGTRFTGAVRVSDGVITDIGDLAPLPGEEVIDATGCVVAPGLVNTHHHLFQSVLKGLAIDEALDIWLAQVPYRYWPRLDEEALRVSARIGLVELALTGATTVCDHHYLFPDPYDYDPAELLFDEAGKLGLRFVLARGGMTKGRQFGPDTPPPPTETLTQFLDGLGAATTRWHDASDSPMTRVACAPTTPNFNVEPGELVEIAQEARRLGLRLHCHLSENEGYAAHTLNTYGQRPVPWLADKGWLGEDVWFAHLVDLTADEGACWPRPGPPWPIARRPMPGLGRAWPPRRRCMASAAPCRWPSMARARTRPPTWAWPCIPPLRSSGPPAVSTRSTRAPFCTGRPWAGRRRWAFPALADLPPGWPPTSPCST